MTAFDTDGRPPTLDWVVNLTVVVAVIGAIAPVAVFVASATRLAAARRERRLVAFGYPGRHPARSRSWRPSTRCSSASRARSLGIVVFLALRPLVASFPLGDLTWYADAIAPPLLPAALVLGAVPS